MESGLLGLHDMTWVVWSLLKVWMPLIILIFTSTSMVSIGKRHLKYPCMKLHSGIWIQDIWKTIYIAIYRFWSAVLYSLLCVQGQSEPCNSLIINKYLLFRGYHDLWQKSIEPPVGTKPNASQLPVKHPNH